MQQYFYFLFLPIQQLGKVVENEPPWDRNIQNHNKYVAIGL